MAKSIKPKADKLLIGNTEVDLWSLSPKQLEEMAERFPQAFTVEVKKAPKKPRKDDFNS
jgi:hypothetical protein